MSRAGRRGGDWSEAPRADRGGDAEGDWAQEEEASAAAATVAGEYEAEQGDEEEAYAEEAAYDVESDSRQRARRSRRRALTTFLVVLLVLLSAFWFAYSYFRGSESGAALTPAPTCRTPDPNALTPDQVTVNVFNATNRAGLAAATSKAMADLGFVPGQVANDPEHKSIPGPAEVRHGPNGKAGAQLVMSVVGEGAVTVDDGRQDASVDLVLGDGFVKIGPLPAPTPNLPECPSTSPSAPTDQAPAASPSP